MILTNSYTYGKDPKDVIQAPSQAPVILAHANQHDISNDWDKSQDHYCDASLIRELPPHCDSNPNSQNWTAPEGDEYSMVLNSSYPKLLIIKLANITGPDVAVTQKPNRKELHVVQSVKHSLA
ncbi:hypothetical protein KL909_000646 [Ogataea angusta]|nr:hypothetical protein KL909_000646 [Ogataea angusta]